MKKFLENLKDPVTDLIGLLIMVFNLYHLFFTHMIDWQWEGLIGMAVGMLFFMMPDNFLIDTIKKITNHFFGDEKSDSGDKE